jgi:hypothetical protein
LRVGREKTITTHPGDVVLRARVVEGSRREEGEVGAVPDVLVVEDGANEEVEDDDGGEAAAGEK